MFRNILYFFFKFGQLKFVVLKFVGTQNNVGIQKCG